MLEECWVNDHLFIGLTLGAVFMITWVLAPLMNEVMFLCKQKNKLMSEKNDKYSIMFAGLKRRAFYWDMTNYFMKIWMIALFNLFDSPNYMQNHLKALLIVMFMIVHNKFQTDISPYKSVAFNHLTQNCSIVLTLTMFGGMVFPTNNIAEFKKNLT